MGAVAKIAPIQLPISRWSNKSVYSSTKQRCKCCRVLCCLTVDIFPNQPVGGAMAFTDKCCKWGARNATENTSAKFSECISNLRVVSSLQLILSKKVARYQQ
eukprot:TRINITY_DN67327_c3_g7_i1.p2 TRINITY_DN67327_c3_g7~~TRINITY_DN67327_c3_g7_i1.p2  ORF type:complete len:102 (-),score=6.79 TRINITY_DN67327_c3_g7_i1:380-685(-)